MSNTLFGLEMLKMLAGLAGAGTASARLPYESFKAMEISYLPYSKFKELVEKYYTKKTASSLLC